MGVQHIAGEFVLSVDSWIRTRLFGHNFNGLHGLSLTPDETCLLKCYENNRREVVVDARDGRSFRTLEGPVDASILYASQQAVMVPQTGQVLVLRSGDPFSRNPYVLVFAGLDDDTVVRTLGDGHGHGPRQLDAPRGLAVLDGDVADAANPDGPVAVVADTCNDRLALWCVRDGTVVRHVGSQGGDPGQFNRPTAVTVVSARSTGSDGARLVVADSGNHRVQVLTRTGTVVRVLQGDAVIRLGDSLPGVTVCIRTGEVLVTDCVNHRVVSWRLSDGGGLRVVCGGVRGAGPGQLAHPWGLVASSDGALWVADTGNHRLSLFR